MEFKPSIYDSFMSIFEKNGLSFYRKDLLRKAKGHVLEIGPGTGANLDYYNFNIISKITFLEPEFNKTLKSKIKFNNFDFIEGDVQNLPFKDNSFDTIVFTLIFCSIKDYEKGLNEIKRVLKKNGIVLFIEHIEPKNQPLKGLFNFTNPLWNKIANGCNLNRNTLDYIENVGFKIESKNYFFKNSFVQGIAKL